MIVRIALATAAATVTLFAASHDVRASNWGNAVENCQGSLPSYEDTLRKRPLAIANEGTTNAFIGCALREELGTTVSNGLLVLFTNRSDITRTVNCTLVSGIAQPFGTPRYSTKTLVLGAGAATTTGWSPADVAASGFTLPSINCTLPPGTEINLLQLNTAQAT